jgi:hypothetical protein
MKKVAPINRLFAFVNKDDSGCWNWTGAVTNNGYGRFKLKGKTVVAHRAAYELLRAPIVAGLSLDHLCRNRLCVNPDHLEPVSMRTNVLRGETITARNAAKTHCNHGHSLSGENLFVRKDGRRRCRACERASQRRLRNTEAYRPRHAAYERNRRKAA